MLDWQPEVITAFMKCLSPANVRIDVLSHKFNTSSATESEALPFLGVVLDHTEPRFGTPYTVVPLPEATVAAWNTTELHASLHLPARNPFIPSDFLLKPTTSEPVAYPAVAARTDACRLWFKQDATFMLPKTMLYAFVYSPICFKSPHALVLSELLGAYVSDCV